ncbi:MAG: hypothetical protein GY849_00110 [Deltaproteobacteria bacterium]|nr:hypothetical protein [Deltaproteobacteria bacterium]
MHGKKKSRKKKPIGKTPLAPDEEALVHSLLQDLQAADPAEVVSRIPGPRIAREFIERLPIHEAPPLSLLSTLDQGFKDKGVSKAVKRLLFKLKKRGLSIEGLYPEKEAPTAIIKALPREGPSAYVGPLDGSGFRAVLITFHRTARGVDMGVGLASDEHGIRHFAFGNYSKKSVKEIKEDLFEKAGQLAETSLSHAATVLEKAYQRHLEIHPDAPEEYLELRPWLLENTSLLNRPAIYDAFPEASTSRMVLTDSQLERLFEHDLMASWFIEFQSLRPHLEEIRKVGDSQIVLTETQKYEREKEIQDKAMEELFPAPKRAFLKQRLEEMAYVFFKLDEEERSGICLAAAQTLDEEDTILRKNPVIAFLLKRSLDYFMDAIHETDEDQVSKDEDAPRILLP